MNFSRYTPLTILISALFMSGCTHTNKLYVPQDKQAYEDIDIFDYRAMPLTNVRFVYLDGRLWMQPKGAYLVEARNFIVTVNATDYPATQKFLILPSDHPMEGFSNLYVDVSFLIERHDIVSLSYKAINPHSDVAPKTLSQIDIKALNGFLTYLRDQNKPFIKPRSLIQKTEINTTLTQDANKSLLKQ